MIGYWRWETFLWSQLHYFQVFIRQGNVIQAAAVDKSRRARIVSKGSDQVRQCYLFTNHMLLCNRTSAGKLHLIEGKNTHWMWNKIRSLQ